jgi:hypothetical protein
VEDFYAAEQENDNKEIRQQDTDVPRWLAPPCGVYTINWMRLLISQGN